YNGAFDRAVSRRDRFVVSPGNTVLLLQFLGRDRLCVASARGRTHTGQCDDGCDGQMSGYVGHVLHSLLGGRLHAEFISRRRKKCATLLAIERPLSAQHVMAVFGGAGIELVSTATLLNGAQRRAVHVCGHHRTSKRTTVL